MLQDWITCPVAAASLAKGQTTHECRRRDPIPGEPCWVLLGRSLQDRRGAINPADFLLPYQVQCIFGDAAAEIGHWCYHAVADAQGHITNTQQGDSGCPVLGGDGAFLGINTRAGIFLQSSCIALKEGATSWHEAHMSHGMGAAQPKLQQFLSDMEVRQGRQRLATNPYPEDLDVVYDTMQREMPTNAADKEINVLGMTEVTSNLFDVAPKPNGWPTQEEFDKAGCAANRRVPATVEDTLATMYSRDNEDIFTVKDLPYKPTQDACGRLIGDVIDGIWHPNVDGKPRTDLLYQTFDFDAELHGDFVKVLVLRHTAKRGSRIRLSGAAIWDAIILWCDITVEDIKAAASISLGGYRVGSHGTHRPLQVYFIIPAAAHSSPNMFSLTNYWNSEGMAPFDLITADREMHIQFNIEALNALAEQYPQQDQQALHWFAQGNRLNK